MSALRHEGNQLRICDIEKEHCCVSVALLFVRQWSSTDIFEEKEPVSFTTSFFIEIFSNSLTERVIFLKLNLVLTIYLFKDTVTHKEYSRVILSMRSRNVI